ncbi:type II toxin-antitoxin system PemK/MazF family toxin [Paraconexibacter sp.]|uniref:type II toxin-antitoxin system PemK/MazF family toxin n=1 Tax=Paraconexibacter sp. TaxID=2949640 RepID=UPI003562029B
MTLASADLRRGALVYGVFPFAAQFPMSYRDDSGTRQMAASVSSYAAARKGRSTVVEAPVKLRPVLLLHDGTRGDKDDVVALRVNSVKPRHRAMTNWARVEEHEHPFFFHLPKDSRYGLPEESVIDLNAVTSVHKSTLWRRVGSINAHEMQIVNERLRVVLGLDLGPLIARQARELLKKAGFAL